MDIESPPTPKPKVKSKRTQKKPVVETPIEESVPLLTLEEDIVQLQDLLRPSATSDLITIREEMGRRLVRSFHNPYTMSAVKNINI